MSEFYQTILFLLLAGSVGNGDVKHLGILSKKSRPRELVAQILPGFH